MASWNGSSVDGARSYTDSGSGVGLPSAFPKNSRGHHNHAQDKNPTDSEHSYTLTETDLAIAARSTLMPTAGEFVPRSQSSQFHRRKPTAPQKTYEPRPKTSYPNSKRHESTSRGRWEGGEEFPSRARGRGGGYETNQRRPPSDDPRTQDRERVLLQTAALLTSMSNPEPVDNANVPRDNHKSNLTYRNEGNRHSNGNRNQARYPGESNHQSNGNRNQTRYQGESNRQANGNRNQTRYEEDGYYQPSDDGGRMHNDGPYRRRNQDRGGKGTETSWRGGTKGIVVASDNQPYVRQGNPSSSNQASPRKETFHLKKADGVSGQRERLTDQLDHGVLECLVCCERIRQMEPVWSCAQCYHVLHLRCVKKWAQASGRDDGWRCPACQLVTNTVPSEYVCFCGKVRDPEWNRQEVAHSCGEVCNKERVPRVETAHCVHPCTLLCHPGPCPVCTAQVNRQCGCGATSKVVTCGGDTALLCGGECGKLLNCGRHNCGVKCHVGECAGCTEELTQVCHCGSSRRSVACATTAVPAAWFACGSTCGKLLSCGHHTCEMACHAGSCGGCKLTPANVTTCPCGKQPVAQGQRASCLDPVPTCEAICLRRLACGQPSCPHECQTPCHVGPCPPCPASTMVRCRCGNMDKEIACVKLTTKADDARCTKRCTKKRSCGKHKCGQLCCIDLDHICPVQCGHKLACGKHRCTELCHRGNCKPCTIMGWEELYCRCGKTATLPPVPCGTRLPECTNPCSRNHPCDHPPQHSCHRYAQCPPCTVFTTKQCYGNHLLRKNVPCYLTDISCGLPCDRPLPCGRHKCVTTCHQGACLKPAAACVQPCTNRRTLCGHMCGAPCHEGACPDTACKEMVKVTCECGHRSVSRACAENAREYQRIATSLLASKMADMQLGHTVDLADLAGPSAGKKISLKTLECNEECKVLERNRRLAIGLQIVNPDLSAKLTPRYSEFMRGWAKKDAHFCQMIHNKLTELVQLAKQSKQKSRSFSFEPMNRDKRHFVHECCEHFGCQSEAYDPEPKRNVVATATRDKAWLPSMSLMEVIQRENGVRKIPKPVGNFTGNSGAVAVTPTPNMAWRSIPGPNSAATATASSSGNKPPEPIDYFDFTASS